MGKIKFEIEGDFPEAVSTKEAAKILGIGYATLFRRIKAGHIQVIKLGGRTLVTKSEIDRVKNEQN